MLGEVAIALFLLWAVLSGGLHLAGAGVELLLVAAFLFALAQLEVGRTRPPVRPGRG